MRYITAVVLFTIGATVQALPVPVFPGSVGLLPRQSNGEGLPELLDTTIADLLHAKSLAALVESKSKVDSCRPNTDLGGLNAD
jgi:hypothetical protein